MSSLTAEAQRRLTVLLILAVLSTAWAAVLGARGVPNISSAAAAPPARVAPACPFPSGLRSAFAAAARDTGLPASLLYAVAKVESNLRQDATSAAGATGVLQVMPATAQSLALNPAEANSNVLAGARYLKLMMDRFRSADLALAAYNAGPTAVDHFGGAPSRETLTYVANVNRLWQRLQGCS